MLLAEHVGENEFLVVEATVAPTGWFSRFVRSVEHAVRRLDEFFRRTEHDYERFNYLGEWHSHPSFALQPSARDDQTMLEILNAPGSNARFVVSLIVKLGDMGLIGEAFAYFPPSEREHARVVLQRTQKHETR